MRPAVSPIAISLGDPAGIGPELIVRAWAQREEHGLAPFVVIGGYGVLVRAAAGLGIECPVRIAASITEAADMFPQAIPVFGTLDADTLPGSPDEEGARLALASLEGAARLALGGKAGAMATAPIAKSHLAKAGFSHPGQTEFLADICGLSDQDAVMMLSGPQLRAVPLTVHCALAEVPGLITADLIVHRTRITIAALKRDFGMDNPRIAVAALNPHAGEDGKFGMEDQTIIAPAIETLQAEGHSVSGPHPADALFSPHKRGSYDAAICMYHDQALIPVKALDFDSGVNVTLGLPIIRTSPDHGTAFDIAGKGIAHPGAMIAAIKMAGECARTRMLSADNA